MPVVLMSAHVWASPPETISAPARALPPEQPDPLPLAHTSTGFDRFVVVPSPS
jgi:hypothetical protein